MNPEKPRFAPLPVRARTSLEVMDTAVKLYRRYFGVLTLWSLVVSATYLISAIVPLVYLLAMPLTYGSISCAIAAAVRGESITFRQAWNFTQPRYGALLGVTLLSLLLFSVFVLAIFFAGALIFGFAVFVLASLPEEATIVLAILGFVLALVLGVVLGTFAFGWMSMVPIVACLEDDKRGVAALGRAWSLLSGSWRRVLVITTLIGLSMLVVFGIVGGFMALFAGGLSEFWTLDDGALLAFGFGLTAIAALFMVFWTPAQAMVVGVLYLDLRVRKEALDLEWNNYQSVEKLPPAQHMAAPQAVGAVPVEMPTPQVSPQTVIGADALADTAPVTSFSGQTRPQSAALPDSPPEKAASQENNANSRELGAEPPKESTAPHEMSANQQVFGLNPPEISAEPTPLSSFAPPDFSLDTASSSASVSTSASAPNSPPDFSLDSPTSFSPSFDSSLSSDSGSSSSSSSD